MLWICVYCNTLRCHLPTAIIDAIQTFAMKFYTHINGVCMKLVRALFITQVHNFPLPRGYDNQLVHRQNLHFTVNFRSYSIFLVRFNSLIFKSMSLNLKISSTRKFQQIMIYKCTVELVKMRIKLKIYRLTNINKSN